MLVSDFVRAASQAGSAALLLTGSAHVWQLAALQAVYGAARAFFGPASTALVPETVAAEDLQRANAVLALSQNVTAVVGPALAGVIVTALRPGWGLAIDALTFVGSAGCLVAMPAFAASARARGSMLHELRGGWSAFISRPWAWITVACFTVYIGFGWAPFQVLAPRSRGCGWAGPAPGRRSPLRSAWDQSGAGWWLCGCVRGIRCACPWRCRHRDAGAGWRCWPRMLPCR